MDYTDIQTKLNTQNLADTFPLLRKKSAEMGNWELTEEVESLWTTYQQMLQFMLKGMNDDQSERIRTNICRQLGFVASRLERLERLRNNTSEKYVSVRKSLKNIPSFESIVNQLETVSSEIDEVAHDELLRESIRQHRMESLTEQRETALLNLFNWTWTSEVWQNVDTDVANRLIFSDSIKTNDKAVFISAVTLSLLEFADMAKLLFLLDCYLVEEDQVSMRALTGFLLAFHLHFDRVRGNQELKNRLFIYRDDASFIHDMYATMMQLQMSCTTDSVTSRMRNDIMPALMKGVMVKRKSKEKDLDPDAFIEHGENPEWMNDEHMNKKMHEMAEMQLDGADIYYGTFSMMKGYSVFNQMPHWFSPFSLSDSHMPELKTFTNGKVNKLIRLILNGSPFCNSDKYSLCFTFNNLGSMAEDAIEAQIASQIPDGMDMDELSESEELQKPQKADIRRHYVFDLYRFYYSYPYKQQFYNPFAQLKEHPVTPFSNPWLEKLLVDDKEELAQYADFLMRKEFYQAALDIFSTLADNEFDVSLASIWQKMGFCHQKLGHTTETIHAYTVANNIKPNSKWTLSHLASLCYAAGQMEEAAKHYQELLQINPDSQKFLLGAAQALMHSHRHQDALPLLHKASYLDENSLHVKQLLAWCLTLCGDREAAAKLILSLSADDAVNPEINVIFTLIMLLDGQPNEAYQRLRHSMNDETLTTLRQHLHTLVNLKMMKRNAATLFMDALILHIN
jgi:tetratricopeptide (TPR) repeat protein